MPNNHYPFELPALGYSYDALEPFFDEPTMKIHHAKHHQAYIDKLNAALEGENKLQGKSPEEILMDLKAVPENIRTAVKNHGGGHANHSLFWPLLKKGVGIDGEIESVLKARFGTLDKFKEELSQAALGLFGSGWAWLVVNKKRELEITTTPNQDSPLTEGKKPILGIDVWEHAYYLKYQNKRADYITAFFEVINWDQVNQNFLAAK
ncbi:MAG: superoxide dismutase [Candidatus Buchananbacteria bacterium RIFCSPHIGHO2_01_FULL_39_14]|uniref:Superoxide dismutase n=2 Tax=Candidatus Buchananiibacteriota TaxID=1817903 RepID=A0A1G1YRF9_9BACT|nr:MAG: superoxide dismutase [Candidatus Buchananbacteria bacterium RIFCSPHIGHO2_01_FULL_39_14]OGY48875.1 MAG: superoxide dismutase [Candidatus Buchananbacteria bacterium RIFCSPHIGHO2_02_FULL_39_17]OGY54396.1 MAG: superoxide dismutase [Candidatus Buchananbacteria bacterium RIFCSPLOWO2_01_FULL_40_23b]